MSQPAEIAREYFHRMRSADLGVLDLFHEDAALIGLGRHVRGKPAISAFYSDAIESGGPQPGEPLTLLADDRKVVAEVEIALRDGGSVHAIDLFEVVDGRIASLTYFIADHPAE